MKWVQRICLIAAMATLTASAAAAQNGRISGTVTDTATGQPVAGAQIAIVGTSLTTTSQESGAFAFPSVPAGSRTLRVTRIGYAARTQTVTVTAGDMTTVAFRLSAQAIQLSEVVSVGYGEQNRRNVTGSVASVTLDALERSPVSTIDQMLQGTSPGVAVTTASAEPGGAVSIRIRGTSSITGNSEPLYVIDGFPIENDIEGSSVGNGGRTRTTPPNPLVTLNPSDIESISILKDASATAIYGARGANGVVIITTKQGRGTRPQFTTDSYIGTAKVAKTYDLLNSAEYMDYANAYGQASSTPANRYLPFPQAVKDSILAKGVNTDWQDEIFQTAPSRNLQLSVRGATSTASPTRYSLSGGVFDQDGIVVGSGLRRMSTRLNLNQSVGSRVELSGQVSASQARSKSVPTAGQQNANAGAVSAAIQYVPIFPVMRADGSYTLINPDLNAFATQLDAPQTPNPVSLAREVKDSLSDTRVLGNFFGQVDLADGLKFKVSLGADYANRSRYTYYPRTTMRGAQSSGEAIRAASRNTSWLNENTLTYNRIFGSHELDLLGGYSRQRQDVDGENMSNSNFVSDITGYFDIGSGTQTGGPSVSSRRTTQTLESWLGRINYNLLDRYLFTLTTRTDGSSRFAAGKKWGVFPSAAVGWRASSESFMAGFESIDDLKFRASYGLVGNPSIRPYQSLARLNDQGYSFGGTAYAGYYTTAVGNPNLTWESTRQTDYGMDLGLFERLSIVADYYEKRTSNLLLQINLPTETGFQSALVNRGSLENRGVELGINADLVKASSRGAFGWRGAFSFAKNENKVTDLGGQETIFAELLTTDYNLPGQMIQVGKPIGMFYGFKSGGVIRDSAAAAAVTWTNFSGSKFNAGDVLILDIRGKKDPTTGADLGPDGKIDNEDRTDLGNPTPRFTWGWTNTVSIRGFEITGLLQGVQGGKILNVNRIRTEGSPRVNVHKDRFYDAWTPTNPDAKFPKIGENPNQVGPNSFSDNLLEDATYTRLRTITASYQIPQRFANRANASAARLYVTGTNLWTSTKYSGFDPDVSAQSAGNLNRGIDIGAYPLARTFTTGISVSF